MSEINPLAGEHRTKPVPPYPHRLVAEIDAVFEQQVVKGPQRPSPPDV